MTETTEPVVDFGFRLDGSVALVTGGASGIGAAIAPALSSKGARVAVVDLNEAGATNVAQSPPGSRGFGRNVADPDSVTAAVDAVIGEFGRIDVRVNSAGIVRLAPAEDLSLADWDSTIAINLKGAFLMCQTAGRHMLAAGSGASSTWLHRPPASHSTSKSLTARRSSAWSESRRCWRPIRLSGRDRRSCSLSRFGRRCHGQWCRSADRRRLHDQVAVEARLPWHRSGGRRPAASSVVHRRRLCACASARTGGLTPCVHPRRRRRRRTPTACPHRRGRPAPRARRDGEGRAGGPGPRRPARPATRRRRWK